MSKVGEDTHGSRVGMHLDVTGLETVPLDLDEPVLFKLDDLGCRKLLMAVG